VHTAAAGDPRMRVVPSTDPLADLARLRRPAGPWLHLLEGASSDARQLGWMLGQDGVVVRLLRGHCARSRYGLLDEVGAALQLPGDSVEDWPSLASLLTDMTWLPGRGHALVVTRAALLLAAAPLAELGGLVTAVREVARGRAEEGGDPVPFHVVLQDDAVGLAVLRARLDAVRAKYDSLAAWDAEEPVAPGTAGGRLAYRGGAPQPDDVDSAVVSVLSGVDGLVQVRRAWQEFRGPAQDPVRVYAPMISAGRPDELAAAVAAAAAGRGQCCLVVPMPAADAGREADQAALAGASVELWPAPPPAPAAHGEAADQPPAGEDVAPEPQRPAAQHAGIEQWSTAPASPADTDVAGEAQQPGAERWAAAGMARTVVGGAQDVPEPWAAGARTARADVGGAGVGGEARRAGAEPWAAGAGMAREGAGGAEVATRPAATEIERPAHAGDAESAPEPAEVGIERAARPQHAGSAPEPAAAKPAHAGAATARRTSALPADAWFDRGAPPGEALAARLIGWATDRPGVIGVVSARSTIEAEPVLVIGVVVDGDVDPEPVQEGARAVLTDGDEPCVVEAFAPARGILPAQLRLYRSSHRLWSRKVERASTAVPRLDTGYRPMSTEVDQVLQTGEPLTDEDVGGVTIVGLDLNAAVEKGPDDPDARDAAVAEWAQGHGQALAALRAVSPGAETSLPIYTVVAGTGADRAAMRRELAGVLGATGTTRAAIEVFSPHEPIDVFHVELYGASLLLWRAERPETGA
jgi:hypothetical protein